MQISSEENSFSSFLTLIWLVFLGVHFEVWWGVKLYPLSLKLVRIMLQT